MDKSKWRSQHFVIHARIGGINSQIEQLKKDKNNAIKKFDKQIKELQSQITRIQDEECKHIDDGGPFIATCSICGWADYYDGG